MVEIGPLVIEYKIAKCHHGDGRDLYLNVGLHCATFVWKWQCDFGKGVKMWDGYSQKIYEIEVSAQVTLRFKSECNI